MSFTTAEQDVIPVFFAADDNYVPYLCIAIKSIAVNCDSKLKYHVHVLNTGLLQANIEQIKMLETNFLKIEFNDVSSKIMDIKSALNKNLRDYYSDSIFYRIFIPQMFPEYHKAIYLDCDVVTLVDIAKLYHVDLKGNYLGAVTDEVVPSNPVLIEYVENVVGVAWQKYFCSGVILFDLDAMRAQEVDKKFIGLLSCYNFDTIAPDQDYLNVICRDHVLYLHPGWDKQANQREYNDDLYIIHYNMFLKPWFYENVPFENYFWYYAKETPFYQVMLNSRASYSDEQKQKDLIGGQKMVETCATFLQNPVTFKSVLANQSIEEAIAAIRHN